MTSDNTNAWSKISPTSPDTKSSQAHKRRRNAVHDNNFEHDNIEAEVPERDEFVDEGDQENEEEESMMYETTRKRFCRRPSAFDGQCLDEDDDEEEGLDEEATTRLEVQVAQLRDTVHVMEQQVAWAVERMVALQGLVDRYEQERRRSIVKS